MKELSEDTMIKNIKEVLEHYEPDYSPQFWEKLRKQRPVPEFRIKKLLLKYKLWLSVITMAGVLFIIYRVTDLPPADKNSAADPQFSEPGNYIVSEKPKEITYSEKRANSISDTGIGREENNITSKDIPVRMRDSLPIIYQDYTSTGNAIVERSGRIEIAYLNPLLPEGLDVRYQFMIPQLLPIKSEVEETPALKSPSFDKTTDKTRNYKFQWPELNFITTKDENYKKIAGPNKLALFYSIEIHRTHSFNTLGVSHGFGISFEGPIRSSVSISVGLSYQAINYHKTIFSEKVPPHLVLQPPDTNRTFYYIDSTGIRSGSYKYLELPVSLNFKFFETTRSQVWLGTGISAIAFLGQNYTSETIVEGVSDQVSSSSAKAWKNIHPLASLNLGLFYRYKFSDRLFLHCSAQYKQHLVPLGYNSMKLNRFNFQAGIIYRFGRKD